MLQQRRKISNLMKNQQLCERNKFAENIFLTNELFCREYWLQLRSLTLFLIKILQFNSSVVHYCSYDIHRYFLLYFVSLH